MAGDRIIQFEGRTIHVPSDFSDAEVAQILHGSPATGANGDPNALVPPAMPKPPNPIMQDAANPRSPVFQGGMPGSFEGHPENLHDYVDASAGEMARGVADMTDGNIRHGVHRIVSGAGAGAAPVVLPFAAAAAPGATVTALASGATGGSLASHVAKWSGGDEDTQDLAGDVGSIVGGGVAGKYAGPVLRGAARAIPSAASTMADIPNPIGTSGRLARVTLKSGLVQDALPKALNATADAVSLPEPPPPMRPARTPLWKQVGTTKTEPIEAQGGAQSPDAWQGTRTLQREPRRVNIPSAPKGERVPLWKQVGTSPTEPPTAQGGNVVHDTSPRSLVDHVTQPVFLSDQSPDPNIVWGQHPDTGLSPEMHERVTSPWSPASGPGQPQTFPAPAPRPATPPASRTALIDEIGKAERAGAVMSRRTNQSAHAHAVSGGSTGPDDIPEDEKGVEQLLRESAERRDTANMHDELRRSVLSDEVEKAQNTPMKGPTSTMYNMLDDIPKPGNSLQDTMTRHGFKQTNEGGLHWHKPDKLGYGPGRFEVTYNASGGWKVRDNKTKEILGSGTSAKYLDDILGQIK